MPQLIFVHVPKTAGVSLHRALRAAFGNEAVFSIRGKPDLQTWRAMSVDQARSYPVVSGHVWWSDLCDKIAPDCRLISLLRDPVARAFSAFNFISSWPEHRDHQRVKCMSFGEYVEAEAESLQAMMCRQLTGKHTADEAIDLLRSRYCLVGTIERMGDFVGPLERLIGKTLTLPHANTTSGQGRLALDSRICERLLEVTAEDRRLYRRVAAQGPVMC